MRGHARVRLGAASGPPPRGPWFRVGLGCGAFSGLLSPLRCPPPTRPPPSRPPPTRSGSPLVGLSACGLSAALSRRFVAAPRRALPRPLGPRFGGSGRGRGFAPAADVFVLFARLSAGRLAGGNPAGAFACGLVRGGAPAPLPRPGAAALREKNCLACLRACLRLPPPRPSVAVRPPLCGSALARRALAVGIVARAATAAWLLAALMLGRPPLRGESGRGCRRLFCAPFGLACGAVGPPARSRPLRSARRLRRPRGALPSRPARRALRLPCVRFGINS